MEKTLNQNKPVPNVPELEYKGTVDKPDIKIFVSHRIDLDSATIDNPLYIPVRCGSVYDKRENVTILGDDTGDNISEKREKFCELTVQYWAWKNVKADYYGLCHYRRYFSFAEKKFQTDIHSFIYYDFFNDNTITEMQMDEDSIRKAVRGYDFLIAEPSDTQKVGFKTLYEQYASVAELYEDDLRLAIDILKKMYPLYSKVADEYMSGHFFYPCNMFIMEKDLFIEYSEWLFSILGVFETQVDFSKYSIDSLRTVGHIAERLCGIFYEYVRINRQDKKTKILQRCLIWNTDVPISPRPYFKKNNIAVVFTFSEYFAPYAAVAIHSLIKNSSKTFNYDILILHTDISKHMQDNLLCIIDNRPNMAMRFVNINNYTQDVKFISQIAHISIQTFYRLFVAEILPHYDKIVYLDSDIVVLHDIADLYNEDIENKLLLVTLDADHAGEYNGAIQGVKEYCDTVLKLENQFSYFQAGVLVFNLNEFRKTFKKDKLIKIATNRNNEGGYMYVDQDVLNICCEGKVRYVDMRWNVMFDCAGNRKEKIIRRAPMNIYNEYLEARKNPFIIHYAGFEKPWENPTSDFADLFWYYARQTPFYEIILSRMMDYKIGAIHNVINSVNQTINTINQAVYNLNVRTGIIDLRTPARQKLDSLLPPGTLRRGIAQKLFPRGSLAWKMAKKLYYMIWGK